MMATHFETVIISVSEAIHFAKQRKNGLLRRFAPLRKRSAFVAGNDGETNFRILAACFARVLACSFRPRIRGRREYRALGAPAAARVV
jgi:hypothetical protein